MRAFFGLASWPDGVAAYDLGGRVLEILPCPGHEEASIAIYDAWSGFLVTGDSVYPGRLYVRDPAAFAASMDRLARFAQERPVRHAMGCHVEMARAPGRDYPLGSAYQPDERPLAMTVAQLTAVRDRARALADRPGAHMFDDFALWIGPCQGAMVRQAARALVRAAALRVGLDR